MVLLHWGIPLEQVVGAAFFQNALLLGPTHRMLGFSSPVPYPPPLPCCAFLYHDGTRKQGRELHLVLNEMKQKS